MDEAEFRRVLDLFPIVRSRHYHAESELPKQSTSQSGQASMTKEWQDAWDDGDIKESKAEGINLEDPFWEKLRLAAEKKVSAVEAKSFCEAFQRVYKKIVYEELSLDVARSFINSTKTRSER